MTRVMVALLLLANVGPAFGQSRRPRLEGTHPLEDTGNIVLAAWSPTGSCLAVATETTVHVINSSGQPLWTWNFRETSRFLHVPQFLGPFAVATTCDVVVIGGDPGYKYVWSANQRGQHTFLKTDGTPLSARFSLRGDTLALVTGAGSGYLLSPRLDVRWRGAMRDLPVRWPSQVVSDQVHSQDVEFSRHDVDQLFGALLWGWGVSDSV